MFTTTSGAHDRRKGREERRSVNRPRVNEIFGQRSHASGYTIFSTHYSALALARDEHGTRVRVR